MFPMESAVTQLRPETIAKLVDEAEEKQWTQLGIPGEEEGDSPSPIHGSAQLGVALLRHGTCIKKIQSYFSHLESRKCCLLLAGRKSTFSNVRVVRDGQDNGLEEGAMKRTIMSHTKDVLQLDHKEFRAFKHAYLCAAFPVLGAPDPPSPLSPSPTTPTNTPPTQITYPRSISSDKRPSTPHSLHDSGVEETDDGAMIPTETLCELLRRAFRLSADRFHHYETMIAKSYQKKSPPKLLAEELMSQLTALENATNTFYSPASFLTRTGYEIWCHHEMSHISDLLNKFWHFSLPYPSDSQLHNKDLATVHEDYEILLSKLLLYEHQFKVGTDDTSSPLFSLLSSASTRLLREFGLRYGIGEQYRRVLYLRHLIEIFSPSVWFLQHMTSVVSSVRDMFPSNKSQLVMTKKEFVLLDTCIKSILVQAAKSFCQMKSIFQTIRPAEGIDILIGLISITLDLRAYLTIESHETLDMFLYRAVQGIFRPTYERYKILAQSELAKKNISPILLNILIGNIRDEVIDYRNNYQSSFSHYMNITEIAAQAFYILLMEDVEELCREQAARYDKSVHEINLQVLGLAYRLNRLDQDWAEHIPTEAQQWRKSLLREILLWSTSIMYHVQDLVIEAVSGDQFQTQEVHLMTPLSSLTGSSYSVHRSQSMLASSLTPSVNSAFSSLVSSLRSTPNKQTAVSDSPSRHPRQPATILETSPETIKSSKAISNAEPEKREAEVVVIRKQGSFETKSLISVEDRADSVKFKGLKQSVSMPNMKDKDEDASEHLRMTQSGDEDSCPFMPLLNESDEMSSNEETRHSKSDIDGSGLVFQATMHNDPCDDDDTSTVASEADANSNVEEDSETEGDFKFPPIQQVSSGHQDSSKVFHMDDTHSEPRGFVSRLTSAFRLPRKRNVSIGTHESGLEYEETKFQNSLERSFMSADNNLESSDRHKEFLDSFSSEYTNVSLPTPPPGSDACLPISGSAIDLVVILQRLVGISRTFYQILFPTLDDLETLEALDEGELSMEQLEFHQKSVAGKEEIYENFLTTICVTSCQYADNMLCLDLCGTPNSAAKRLIGPKLLEHLTNQQNLGLVWGCRHEVDGKNNCFEYLNKQTAYLCDRYEPITQQMCTRINNVSAMLKFLEIYERRLANTFGEKDLWINSDDMHRNRMNPRSGRESCFSVQDFSMVDRVDELEKDEWPDHEELQPSSDPFVLKLLNPHQSHLLAIQKAQCRLMAYRLNLFLHDALALLMRLKPLSVSIQDCLKPVTNFLQKYMEKLSGWLYKDCFHQLLECLWIFLVEDLETEAEILHREEEDSVPFWAQTVLQALTHLLKFMNNFGKGITRNLLLSQADELIFKLLLHSLSIHQLLALYSKLTDYSLGERGMFPHEIEKPAPAVILQKIQRDLQRFRKCFSGKELIRWIFRNRDLFYRVEPVMVERSVPFTKDIALEIVLKFLDLRYIVDLETDDSRSPSPTNSGIRYPEISIHTQFTQTTDLHSRAASTDPYDLTPTASPTIGTYQTQGHSSLRNLTSNGSTPTILQDEDVPHKNTLSPENQEPAINGDTSKLDDAMPGHESGSFLSSMSRHDQHETGKDMEPEPSIENRAFESLPNLGAKCEESKLPTHHQLGAGSKQSIASGSNFLGSYESGTRTFPMTHPRQHHLRYTSEGTSLSSLYTPLSFRSDTSYIALIDSARTFFHVLPHAVEENGYLNMSSPAFESYIKENSDRFTKLMRSRETADMVEKCFQRKIKPVFLLTIVYGMRKSDPDAKTFVKQLPAKVLDKIKHQLHS
ncbi:uncharacterized protein [Haliotis asinina]|uniref:uncharacterized protein n=1 Tax=Haliotis asinina TaxID=109174 RepID=UPI00353255DE